MFGIMRFITGLGVGALVATTGALVSEYAPPGKKNLVNAITYSGVPIGSLMAALLAIILLHAIGWRGMFWIGALPLVTLFPLAIVRMPESVAWLASRGRFEEARAISVRTGVPMPEEVPKAPSTAGTASPVGGGRAGFAGLFGPGYLFPTIVLGLMSATGLVLVYSLNTWLPELMLRAGFNAKGSLSFLLVLNGGAILGAVAGSRVADRLGPKPVVAGAFLAGAVAIALLTLPAPLGILLFIVAIAGLGTSGTQTLIYGFVANYYRTNVRGAGVAWCAGFGRLGGVGGPLLGGFLVGAGFALDSIFYVLTGLALLGLALTLLVPSSTLAGAAFYGHRTDARHIWQARRTRQNVLTTGFQMYKRILVAIDATPAEENRSALARTEQIGHLTGATVYVLHFARAHIVPGDIIAGSHFGVLSADDDVEAADRQAVQRLVDSLAAAGIDAHGEMLSATEHDMAEVILQRARERNVDLIVLGHQHHRGARNLFQSSVAERVIRQHPPCSILLARPPT